MKDCIQLGVFAKAIGLKGEIRISSYGDVLSAIKFPKTFILLDLNGFSRGKVKRHNMEQLLLSLDFASCEHVEILNLKAMPKNGLFRAVVAGIENRDVAEKLTGKAIFYSIEDMPILSEGDYYYFQLLNFSVVSNDTGDNLGTVSSVAYYGA